MKNIVKIIISASLTMPILFSCNSWLEEKNYGNPTTKDMMSKEENVVLLVGQAYADVKWLHDHWGYWGVASLTSDECLCPIRMPGEHWSDGGYWRNLNTHNWDPMANAFKNIWNTTISGAVLCNKLLSTLEASKSIMSESVYKQYVGELETLRTYYYYMLFDCFGRIPYKEKFEDKTEPLMAPQDVWSKLVTCLEKNAPNLPVVNDANRATNYGRVTQGFAYSLLARLYLNAESFGCTPDNVTLPSDIKISSVNDFYTAVVRCCDKIINSGSYKIEPDFFTNFKIDNSASKENIFVIVENGNGDFDARSNGSMSNKLRIEMLTMHYCQQKTYDMIEKPWNGFCARPSFIDRYAGSDVRGPGNEGKGTKNEKQWGWFLGPIYSSNGETLLKDENGDPAVIRKEIKSLDGALWGDGARMFKYEIDKDKKYQFCENDFVLFRYADVLWMKEEALLRGGSGSSSAQTEDFKTMLRRAFAYDADGEVAFKAAYPKALTLEGILDERGREFAWENIRRRDLIRFGKFNDPSYVEYITGTDDYRRWFPIPYSVLEKSVRDEQGHAIWTQNPGYNE
jgi:hypothetical protein